MNSKLNNALGELVRFAKFSGVGCLNVLLDLLVYTICFQFLKLPAYQAQLMGVVFGLSSSYLLNRSYTFKSTSPFFGTELFKFAVVSMICVPLSSAGINWLVKYTHLGPWIGKAIVTAAVGLLNFFLSRSVVFHPIRKRKPVKFCMDKTYEIAAKIRYSLKAAIWFVMANSILIDWCVYLYLTYVGLDSYKAQPLCVAIALVCCYLLSLKFIPYKIERFVGFFCTSIIAVMTCSPIMYLFEVRFDLHALIAKIPATVVMSALVMLSCRYIVFRDKFEEK